MREPHSYENDKVIGFQYEDESYYFEKNAQGDVLRIYDEAGAVVSEYIYDAWGNVVDIVGDEELAKINPFRYRGYYQDNETGFYYLQSRYYDGVTGRFLNADDSMVLVLYTDNSISANIYTYSYNNYVNIVDYNGLYGTPIQWACAVIGGIAGWFFGDFVARKIGLEPGKWWELKTHIYAAFRALVVVGGAVLGYVAGAKLLGICKIFLANNPVILAKMPNVLLWFLGLGNTSTFSNATFQNAGKLAQHFQKHAHEWGGKFKNAQDYLQGARRLLNTKAGGQIYEFVSRDGWLFKYNARTNEFVLVSDKGTISSFFRPADGIKYWLEQVKKYKP